MQQGNLKIGVLGCLGRMGQAIVAAVEKSEGCVFVAGAEMAGHPGVGTTVSNTDVQVTADTSNVFAASDVVIDFTPPGNTACHAELAAKHTTSLVVGTTGFTEADNAALNKASEETLIIQAGNYSLGVNLLKALTKQVAATLGTNWDIEIVETHHKHKVDAPSGTAIMLGESAAEGRGKSLESLRTPAREGITGEREEGSIGFSAIRAGSVIGEHDVVFASSSERITLSHKAENRALFAEGAVHAALWSAGKAAGRYSMMDVLDLS